MELEIQKYLRANSPEKLKEEFAINYKQHRSYPELYLFKYNQIDSPMGERICQEARGIILNSEDNWEVVARGFDKFWNESEHLAAKIDWDTARVYEKLDGSLCLLYFYKDNWHVATSGTPDASGEVNGFDFTFGELFWDTFYKNYIINDLPNGLTYIFELTSPYNKIIVNHKDSKLTLLGVRDPFSGVEYEPAEFEYCFDIVKSYSINSLDECLKEFEWMNGAEQEGFVVCDDNFNRVKIKHPKYVALHHIKGSYSPRNLLKIIQNGEVDEVICSFPEYKDEILEFKEFYERLIFATDLIFSLFTKQVSEVKDNQQKAFALLATQTPFSGVLFRMRKEGITNSVKFYREMDPDSILKIKEEIDNDFIKI